MDLAPLFQKLGEFGAMGALSAIVFFIARKDYLANKDELIALYKDVRDDKAILVNLVKENSVAVTALTEIVKNLPDKLDRPYLGPDRRKNTQQ